MSEENKFYKYRKRASINNPVLKNREGAAELLDVSVETISAYELGTRQNVPAERILPMAELYNAPELINEYCTQDCLLGKCVIDPIKVKDISIATLSLLDVMNKLPQYEKVLIDVGADKTVEEKNISEYAKAIELLKRAKREIESYLLMYQKESSLHTTK